MGVCVGGMALKMIYLILRGQSLLRSPSTVMPFQIIRNITLNMLTKCEIHTYFKMLEFFLKKQILGLRK